jgi:hypothetical protein
VLSQFDSPVNDVEDSDTSNRADSGCSAAAGGTGMSVLLPSSYDS